MRLTKLWDKLDPETLRNEQATMLRRFLGDHVIPFSKYYREKFALEGVDSRDIRSLDDLAKLPFTSKRNLIGEDGTPLTRDFVLIPDENVLKRRPSTIARAILKGSSAVKEGFAKEYRPILMTSTTGRSAEPVPFLYTQKDLDNLAVTGRRMMELCESVPEYRHMNLFPFAPHLAFWQAHYAGLGFTTFNLSTGGGKVMGTDGNVRLLGKILPDALIGMPTFIYHVLQVAAERGIECPNIKRIVLGGEKVPEGMRRKLRALCAELGSGTVEVMATYGFTEAKMAWPECYSPSVNEPTGYHLSPDLGIVEIVEPDTGEVVGEGEPGEIVYTPLDSRGSVVLRYRTGDHISGGLTYETCPGCGRRMPRLLGQISRVSNIRRLDIGKIKGTLVNFNDLEHVLDDLEDVGSWQIELRKRNDDPLECDEIVVHVSPRGRVSADKLREDIEQKFLSSTEVRPNSIELHDAKKMREMQGVGTALKEEKIVDRRDLAKSAPAPAELTTPPKV